MRIACYTGNDKFKQQKEVFEMELENLKNLIHKKKRLYFDKEIYVPIKIVTRNLQHIDSSVLGKLYLLRHIVILTSNEIGYDLAETAYYSSAELATQLGLERTTVYKVEKQLVNNDLLSRSDFQGQKAKCLTKIAIALLSLST
jgi:predicted transcriptional regulator